MAYDYSKLIGKIIEMFGTRSAFADALKISEKSLSAKLTNQSSFKQPEISKAVTLLKIGINDISDYFFITSTCRKEFS